jgi:hypothetical protein
MCGILGVSWGAGESGGHAACLTMSTRLPM